MTILYLYEFGISGASVSHGHISSFLSLKQCPEIMWHLEIFIPTLLKKRMGYCYHLSPSILSVMLSPPKSNQFWYVRYSHEWSMQQHNFFLKVKYHSISITKSNSKISIQNFVCVLTNKRYKTYQTEFLFCRLGHAPGVGLGGAWDAQGVKKFFLTWSCGISN